MRIAIVDDCENERNELCKRLSQSSFSRSYDIEICGYGNGTDFLNDAMQNRFDLVFMDIYMEMMFRRQQKKTVRKHRIFSGRVRRST